MENVFGMLKMRFPIPMTELRLKKVERSVAVIRACFATHNLRVLGFVPADNEPLQADQLAVAVMELKGVTASRDKRQSSVTVCRDAVYSAFVPPPLVEFVF